MLCWRIIVWVVKTDGQTFDGFHLLARRKRIDETPFYNLYKTIPYQQLICQVESVHFANVSETAKTSVAVCFVWYDPTGNRVSAGAMPRLSHAGHYTIRSIHAAVVSTLHETVLVWFEISQELGQGADVALIEVGCARPCRSSRLNRVKISSSVLARPWCR